MTPPSDVFNMSTLEPDWGSPKPKAIEFGLSAPSSYSAVAHVSMPVLWYVTRVHAYCQKRRLWTGTVFGSRTAREVQMRTLRSWPNSNSDAECECPRRRGVAHVPARRRLDV